MPLLAILADDLTGAADAGCAFAGAGLTTTIAFGGLPETNDDVFVLSTSSRGSSADQAAVANANAIRLLHELPSPLRPQYIYKKIDSALRGHPCAELVAIMDELGERRALIAPALPAENRLTLGSRHYVDGAPLDRTEFAATHATSALPAIFSCGHERLVHSIDITDIRRGMGHVTRLISRLGDGILIADAESDADLEIIAQAAIASGVGLMAGSAGLANQLAIAVATPGLPRMHRTTLRKDQPVLIVAGSQHLATASQVEHLEQAGVPIIRPTQDSLDEGELPADDVIERLASALTDRGSAVLTTAGLELSPAGGEGVIRHLSLIVAALMDRRVIGGIVLTGGEVAAGIAEGLGARELALGGEVLPAIPWGYLRLDNDANLPVVTKAGSFGNREALVQCLRFLHGS